MSLLGKIFSRGDKPSRLIETKGIREHIELIHNETEQLKQARDSKRVSIEEDRAIRKTLAGNYEAINQNVKDLGALVLLDRKDAENLNLKYDVIKSKLQKLESKLAELGSSTEIKASRSYKKIKDKLDQVKLELEEYKINKLGGERKTASLEQGPYR